MKLADSYELEGLKRAETQRMVLLCLVEHGEQMSSVEIAEKLSLSLNAVNIALFNLNNKGLVERISRGVYKYKLGPIIAPLLKEYFERN
ncbi:winged helix-turn-helix transcriptional regulator [Candidatus Bathyarchaeota archaeon]|nr:winged helix-turn-helix transcriptional regulator [Candidatus Bathyarchaeota archaeon]